MSRLSNLFSTSLLGGHAHSPRERQTDGLTRLRFALETMASSRKYTFTPSARLEVLAELYQAFWGIYPQYFLPPNVQAPIQSLLSEVQNKHGFAGAGGEEKIVPGRSCGHIFMKGESCYRCKCVQPNIYYFLEILLFILAMQGLCAGRQLRHVLAMLSCH